jgi:hypothetical protein
MKVIINLAIIFAVFYLRLHGQSPYRNVQIDSQEESSFSYPPCEPSICINPLYPASIVAGAVLDGVYMSADSGSTWTKSTLSSRYGVFGDPCVVANRFGDFYNCHLGDPGGMGWGSESILDCIVCQRSRDLGLTWDQGTPAGLNPPKDQDKEWAICSPSGKHIYMTWTQFDRYESDNPNDSTQIMFSRSTRKMKRWKKAIRINQYAGDCADDDLTVEGAVPAAGPDGQVYVAWAVGETIWFDRSLNGGKTWLTKDISAGRIAGGWNQDIPGILRTNGMPVLVSDLSGGVRNGYLYLCWSDIRNGADNTDIFFSYSSDQGNSWSDAIRVNDDTGPAHQFFPWLSIDQTTGKLYLVFYDRRKNEGDQTDVYLASSDDGGLSWANERISQSSFVPDPEVFFGDYINISAHNGMIRPIWTRCEQGKLSLWTALINK